MSEPLGFPFNQLPEPVQEEIKQARDRGQLEIDVLKNNLRNFFETASEEHLLAVRSMLAMLRAAPEGIPFYEGILATFLFQRFNKCIWCSEDHTADFHLLDSTSNEPAEPEASIEMVRARLKVRQYKIEVGEDLSLDEVQALNEQALRPPVDLIDRAKMEEWGLDDLWAEGTEEIPDEFLGYVCATCKINRWPSIQDRMLSPKGIEGCPACQNKAKWG